jgi:ABC-type antimicrobial peptide transport system permease subunit
MNIYSLVLQDGLVPVLAASLAGVAVTFALQRFVRSLLYGVSPYNSTRTAGGVCMLVAMGTVACLLPARRAASVDPMQALRRE